MGGDAVEGVNYTIEGVNGDLQIPAGASSTTVKVHSLTPSTLGKNKKVIMSLKSFSSYKLPKAKRGQKAALTILNR